MNGSFHNIAIIINELYMGGAQRLVLDEIPELLKRGIHVSLITLRPMSAQNSFDHSPLVALGAEHICIHFPSLLSFKKYVELVSFLKAGEYDLLITHLWFSNTIGRICGVMARVPRILSFEHNVYDSLKSPLQFFVDRILQSFSYRIVAVSNAVRASLISHGIRPVRVRVLLNAISLSNFSDPIPNEKDIRKDLNLPHNAFVFVSVGRLTEQKAPEILIDALAMTSDGYLLLVGVGEQEDEIRKRIAEKELTNRVRLLGARTDVPSILRQADCFVFSSRWEGVGIVLLEAMAAGLPIISTNFIAAREIIVNEENGLLVQVDDAEMFSQAMKRVRKDHELRTRLANAGRAKSKQFGIEQHVDKLLRIAAS